MTVVAGPGRVLILYDLLDEIAQLKAASADVGVVARHAAEFRRLRAEL